MSTPLTPPPVNLFGGDERGHAGGVGLAKKRQTLRGFAVARGRDAASAPQTAAGHRHSAWEGKLLAGEPKQPMRWSARYNFVRAAHTRGLTQLLYTL